MPHPSWFFIAALISFLVLLMESTGRNNVTSTIGWSCATMGAITLGCIAVTGGYKGGHLRGILGKD
jgi:hypothetical protein